MLIYTKIVDNIRKLFGNYSGNVPTNEDPELSYTDENGMAIELQPGDTYVDGGSSEGIQRVKRLSDNTEIVVSIGDEVVIGEKNSTPTSNSYLTFSSDAPFTLGCVDDGSEYRPSWDGTLEYSTNTETWTQWDGSSTISSGSDNKIYLRGTGNTTFAPYDEEEGYAPLSTDFNIQGTSGVACSGNIETLLDHATVARGEHPVMAKTCFCSLFYNCILLTTAPELPATTLEEWCYEGMFSGCESLTAVPELPATTLEHGCYGSMFAGCLALTTPPVLPATSLAANCYQHMFAGCMSLTTPPVLPATILADWCYFSMCEGCNSLRVSKTQTDVYTEPYRIPSSGTGTNAQESLSRMFSGTGGTFADTPFINTTYYIAVN